MKYADFMQKAILQDGRNKFAKCSAKISGTPEELSDFYRDANPVDVEISCEGTSVRFFSFEELEALHLDYPEIEQEFVFATSNGDPIAIREGKVYTCAHGAKEFSWELLADSFDEYLDRLFLAE